MSIHAVRHRKGHIRAVEPPVVVHRPRREHRAAWPPHTLETRRDPQILPVRRSGRRGSDREFVSADRLLGGAVTTGTVVPSVRPPVPAGAANAQLHRNFRLRTADFLPIRKSISIVVNQLLSEAAKLVHVLRSARLGMTAKQLAKRGWTGPADFRIICDCQRHALRERTLWRRSLRAAGRMRRSGVMLLIGIPMAFGTFDLPMNAKSGSAIEARAVAPLPNSFRVFYTPMVRREFLEPPAEKRTLTLEVMKEEFFRTRVPYGVIIYREANRNRLPPELVAAVVEAESDFRPRLISGKNAQGLMQIIPSTGEDLGVGNLFDPEQNVAAGARYLRYLLDRFGNVHMALAAYNAGEGNIEKFGGIPPFPETISYIQRVNSTTRFYRQRVRDTFLVSSHIRTSYAH